MQTAAAGIGPVMAVADGEGRNSVWLAEQGLDVHAIDFSPTAQVKARALARERGVNVIFELADVHNWIYPEAAYDVVCEIFTQLAYGTGGPKHLDQLYTRPKLETAFGHFQNLVFTEEELEMHEGAAHSGMSAVIGLTCQKP